MRFVVALLLAFTLPAEAALIVCNKSSRAAKVAVGLYDGAEWTSRGWWWITPKTCTTVVNGTLSARYYYLYASDAGAGSWDGSRGFCVAPKDKFEITGRENCAARNFERKGFFEVDTGNAADYTQSLSD